MRVLIVDHYDSFTYNLHQYLLELGAESLVRPCDQLELGEILRLAPTHLVLSPGPGTPLEPRDLGISAEVIRQLAPQIPTLGVCLGHQAIVHVFGGRVVRAPRVMHGKTSRVRHDGSRLFAGLAPEIEVMRYHSLLADAASLPEALRATATTVDDGLVMALEHTEHALFGIQFHPESIGTPDGKAILKNFLEVR